MPHPVRLQCAALSSLAKITLLWQICIKNSLTYTHTHSAYLSLVYDFHINFFGRAERESRQEKDKPSESCGVKLGELISKAAKNG